MKIALAADHAGYEIKEVVKKFLSDNGHEVIDYGAHSTNSVDYPDTAHPATQAVVDKKCERAVLICGTGQGMQLVANRYPGIRATLAWNVEIAEMARGHNDSNVLTMPGRYIDAQTAIEITKAWLNTPFEGGRHERRVKKIHNPDYRG